MSRLAAGCVLVVTAMVATSAWAAGGVVKSPTEPAPDRYVYYPGTEVLAKGEVRVIACGTGMPDQRIAQASACFLFEFGNFGLDDQDWRRQKDWYERDDAKKRKPSEE